MSSNDRYNLQKNQTSHNQFICFRSK